MSRALIFGGAGMLGHKLWQVFRDRFDTWVTIRSNYSAYASYNLFDPSRTIEGVNVFDFDTVIRAFTIAKPDIVVNAIGIIKQLHEAKDPILSLTINSLFPHRLALLCQAAQARLIHISTDCVFSGRKGGYTETDEADPLDLYGHSKLLGEVSEANSLTIRTSMIGRELRSCNGLVEWFLNNKEQKIKGYVNAIYTGFPTLILAQIITNIITQWPNLYGLWHVSSSPINKYELLCLLQDIYQVSVEIEPFADFYCDRSLDSTRFREVTGFVPQPWPEMIQAMVTDPTSYDMEK